MQQISCDTALVRTMGYIGSVVPFALEACVTAKPIYAMWHSCMYNYYVNELLLAFPYSHTSYLELPSLTL